MKTLREYLAEQAELAPQRERRNRDRLKALGELIDDLERSNIALAARTSTPALGHKTRELIRRTVRAGDAIALEIACDQCGVELFDVAPNVRSVSRPRLRQLGCPGCGWAAQTEL